jgi:hypothetical protein
LATNPRSAGTQERRKSMMRTSNSMARRRNEVRKGDILENMDVRAQVSSNVSSTEAYTDDSGISRVHTRVDLE